MLETLLESRARNERSFAGAVASVTAHTALIAAALYATAQARVVPATASPETFRPFFFPSPQNPVSTPSSVATAARPRDARRLTFSPPRIELNVPAFDIANLATKPGDFIPNPITPAGSNPGGAVVAGHGNAPLLADQVEKQAALAPGNAPPRYPERLRASGVEGSVTAVFVVDENGRAEQGSVRFVQSTNRLFEEAVTAALGRMRFVPAEVGGRKVRQLVQMPFVFTLAR